MNSQHRKLKSDNNNFVPEEGQRDFLCCNKESLRCPSLGVTETKLSEETIRAVRELGAILRRIHDQRISEGYVFRNGKFIKPDEGTTRPT
jgi:hypothetical protein